MTYLSREATHREWNPGKRKMQVASLRVGEVKPPKDLEAADIGHRAIEPGVSPVWFQFYFRLVFLHYTPMILF